MQSTNLVDIYRAELLRKAGIKAAASGWLNHVPSRFKVKQSKQSTVEYRQAHTKSMCNKANVHPRPFESTVRDSRTTVMFAKNGNRTDYLAYLRSKGK